MTPKEMYMDKRAQILVRNLQNRHFGACYCKTREEALSKALELIPEGASIGWGGATSAQQIGLLDAVHDPKYHCIDRDTAENRTQAMRECLHADVFITGANGISLDGQMVNIDGIGNRLAAICYGPKSIIVIAGMNKVCDSLEAAIKRARTVAAPINKQRFSGETPCLVTGSCGDCKSEYCICNEILVTRNCRPAERIQFVLVGEELGF